MVDLCIKRDVLIEKQKDNTMLIVFLSVEEDTLKDILGSKIDFGSWFQGFSLKIDFSKRTYILQGTFLVTSFLQSGATSYIAHSWMQRSVGESTDKMSTQQQVPPAVNVLKILIFWERLYLSTNHKNSLVKSCT